MGKQQRIHPLDRLINDDSLFFLEAMIPFVDSNLKKILVILIKIKELSAIMNSLSNPSYLTECGFDCHPKNTDEFISGMCNFMPDNFKSSINQMQQMMQMMKVMNAMEGLKDTEPVYSNPNYSQNNNSCNSSDNCHDTFPNEEYVDESFINELFNKESTHDNCQYDNQGNYQNDYQGDYQCNSQNNYQNDYQGDYQCNSQNNYQNDYQGNNLYDTVIAILNDSKK